MSKQVLVRLLLTIGLLLVGEYIRYVLNPILTVSLGEIAGNQFQNSDAAAIQTYTAMSFLTSIGGLITLIGLILFIVIWWRFIRMIWAPTAMLLVVMLSSHPASAYYDKTDYTEAYTILPNESAFFIPDIGNNKDNQAQMDSEAFLNANKVALKRYIVPHVKLSGSGSFYDYYVPAGRLMIVDRTTFSREWVDDTERGTAKKKEGFPCQTKEGLNVTVGISVGASVLEANAAKYLYHFGVMAPSGDRADPKVIFTSVYYSRKLADVMDDVGRKKIQTLACDQISAKTLDEANAEAVAIMKQVNQDATAYFASVGITLDFIGWANTFEFDTAVQDAVNRLYIAKQDEVIAKSLAPYATTIQALAAAGALREFGTHTDGKLPTTIVGLPSGMMPLLNNLLGSPAPPTAPSTLQGK